MPGSRRLGLYPYDLSYLYSSGTVYGKWGRLFPALWEKNSARLKISIYVSFVMIAAVALAVNLTVVVFTDPIMSLLCVPEEIYGMMRE